MRKLSFSVEQIRSFIAVSRSENLSRAAELLSLTQGGVTQQLRHFERALGLQLVERTNRGVRLTPAGAAIATACVIASRDLEGIDETARMHRALDIGTLMLGASPTCANHYVPPLLAAFLARWPKVDIKVVTASTPTVAGQVANAELDCGLVEGPTSDPNLESRPLYEDAMVVAVSTTHPLAKSAHGVRSALESHVYLSRESSSATEAIARQLLGASYPRLQRLEFSHLDSVRAAAIAGLGFAVLPEVAISEELKAGRLARLGIKPVVRTISAIRRVSSKVPVVEAFWSVLPANVPTVKSER